MTRYVTLMAMTNNHRWRNMDATREREEKLREFLYEEGPHTADQIITHFGWGRDHAMKLMTSMVHAGILEKAKLVAGSQQWYWLVTETS